MDTRCSKYYFLAILIIRTAYQINALDERDLEKALLGLERVTGFFHKNAAAINTDGLYGLRLGQGQLEDVLRRADQGLIKLPLRLHETIKNIYEKLDNAAVISYPHLLTSDGNYFLEFKPLVSQPFPAHSTYRGINVDAPSSLSIASHPSANSWSNYNENFGDKCFLELIGTSPGPNENIPCIISEPCWSFMTTPRVHEYYLTHQLLYFIAAREKCEDLVQKRLKPLQLEDAQQRLCQSIYEESEDFSQGGTVASEKRDLFIEQNLLCAVAGYKDFLSSRRLNMLLSWENKRFGCYPITESELYPEGAYQKLELKTRTKRNDAMMEEGCRSHMSGLSMGLLGCYVRQATIELFQADKQYSAF